MDVDAGRSVCATRLARRSQFSLLGVAPVLLSRCEQERYGWAMRGD